MKKLHEIYGGAAICMVTHDSRYAKFAQRENFLFDGRVVDERTLARLREEEDRHPGTDTNEVDSLTLRVLAERTAC